MLRWTSFTHFYSLTSFHIHKVCMPVQMLRPFSKAKLAPLQPDPVLIILEGFYLCEGINSPLFLNTAVKFQTLWWFTCFPRTSTNVKSLCYRVCNLSFLFWRVLFWRRGGKKPFLQSEGKKNLFLQASWFSPLSLPNSPKGCLTPLCQSAYSQEVAPNTYTPLKQGLEKPWSHFQN